MKEKMNDLKNSIEAVLAALENLGRSLEHGEYFAKSASHSEKAEVIPLLKTLLIKRIEVLRCFETLIRLDTTEAKNILLKRYLGKNVSPDGKFGGYEYELMPMLSDLAELGSESLLVEVLESDRFDHHKLNDPRVRRALSLALDLENEDDLDSWLKSSLRQDN